MKILVMNLTRFGDLLQTQAAIADLSGQGHQVGVVCLENFAGAAMLLSGVQHVAALPSASFLAALAASSPIPDGNGQGGMQAPVWSKALVGLADWRRTLRAEFSFDTVCNLTPTLSARLLALFLAEGRPCAGYSVDEHGFGVNSNSWAAFLQGASASRGVSPFNVVDIFRMAAQVEEGAGRALQPGESGLHAPDGAHIRTAGQLLRAKAPEGCAGFVALQLGASEERRRWPVASFAALGERLWQEERLCPVLLGSASEKHLAQRYSAAVTHPHIVLCGETGLEELAATLCSMRLLVTNDTGTMHLAAGLGVPVLAIFLATAQPFDTGPYRAGSCSVEPDLPCHPCAFGSVCLHEEVCRHVVSADFMASLALSHLREGEWRMPENAAAMQRPLPDSLTQECGSAGHAPSGGRVWISEHDTDGFMTLRSLSGHESDDRTRWLIVQRHFIRRFLDRDRGCDFVPCPLPEPQPLSAVMSAALVKDLDEAAGLVDLLQQQGKVLTMRPMPMMRERFLATWQKVHASLKRSRYFGALSVLWLQETQAEGQDLPVVLAVAGHFQQLLSSLKKENIL